MFGHFLLSIRRHRTFVLRCTRLFAALTVVEFPGSHHVGSSTSNPYSPGGPKTNDASTRFFLFDSDCGTSCEHSSHRRNCRDQRCANPARRAGALEYTLSDETGTVIESNEGKQPMSYIHGKGHIIPGLEKELSGMKVGEEKKIQVKPEDGYGSSILMRFRKFRKTNSHRRR